MRIAPGNEALPAAAVDAVVEVPPANVPAGPALTQPNAPPPSTRRSGARTFFLWDLPMAAVTGVLFGIGTHRMFAEPQFPPPYPDMFAQQKADPPAQRVYLPKERYVRDHYVEDHKPRMVFRPSLSLDYNGVMYKCAGVMASKVEQLPKDVELSRLAVFQAHGSTRAYAGLSADEAVDMVVNGLLELKKEGTNVDYVVLESCLQGDRTLNGSTPAKRFQKLLDTKLEALGFEGRVRVLAPNERGSVYTRDHQPGLLNELGEPVSFVPADEQALPWIDGQTLSRWWEEHGKPHKWPLGVGLLAFFFTAVSGPANRRSSSKPAAEPVDQS